MMFKKNKLVLAMTMGCFVSGNALATTFTDVSENAGFFGLNASWGSAWGDYDNDGDPDVMTVAHLQEFTDSVSQLWRNNGDGTFTDVTLEAGIDPITGDTHSAAWSDLDNDGDLDLYIVNGSIKSDPLHNNQLWMNNGDGTFTDVANTEDLIAIGHRGRGITIVDYNRDGRTDIFAPAYDRGTGDRGNMLLRNDGAMTFTDVAEAMGILRDTIINRTASWADFNNDEYPDVSIANPCALFANQGGTAMVEVTIEAGIDPSDQCTSTSWADYDDDGDQDLYVSRGFDAEVEDSLYQNNGDGTFVDVTAAAGITNINLTRSASWGDYDNDGDKDLYVVNFLNGNKANRLYRNEGDGTFTDVAADAGVQANSPGAGADSSFVDYNLDGFLDLFLTNGEGNASGPYLLFENDGNDNNWLVMKPKGRISSKDALNTDFIVTTQSGVQYYTHSGPTHFMAHSMTPVHIGLGSDDVVERILFQWPNGARQRIENLAANQVINVEEGKPLWIGTPKFGKSGFFIWQGQVKWKVLWVGDPAGESFSGRITTNGEFTELRTLRTEPDDVITWDSTAIDFDATEANIGFDSFEFGTTGKEITFELFRNGVADPETVYIGPGGVRPGRLPLLLRR